MKKNFLAIASLLIAAMLLMVSCNQEVAPVDNGLVNVTLSTSVSGKAIEVGGVNDGAIAYTYTVAPQWTDDGKDTIVGSQTGNVTLNGANATVQLGYMSQGLWKFTVEGKRGDDIVLKGETTTYITKGASSVVVFLKAEAGAEAGLEFDVTVNDLANNAANYSVSYEIKNASNERISHGTLDRTDPELTTPGTGENALTKSAKYKLATGTAVKLGTGYYRVTVSLKNGDNVIGGITKGFLVLKDEDSLTVRGYVTAADFAKGSLNVVRPQVDIALSAKVGNAVVNASTGYTVTGAEGQDIYNSTDDSVKVDFAAKFTINTDVSQIDGVTLTSTKYIWNVDGNETVTNESATHSVPMAPGYRKVTCTVYNTYEINNGVSTYTEVIADTAYFDFKITKN